MRKILGATKLRRLVENLARQDEPVRENAVQRIDLAITFSESLLLIRIMVSASITGSDFLTVMGPPIAIIVAVWMSNEIEGMFTKLRQMLRAGVQRRRYLPAVMMLPNLACITLSPGIVSGALPRWFYWLSQSGVFLVAAIALVLNLIVGDSKTLEGGDVL